MTMRMIRILIRLLYFKVVFGKMDDVMRMMIIMILIIILYFKVVFEKIGDDGNEEEDGEDDNGEDEDDNDITKNIILQGGLCKNSGLLKLFPRSHPCASLCGCRAGWHSGQWEGGGSAARARPSSPGFRTSHVRRDAREIRGAAAAASDG